MIVTGRKCDMCGRSTFGEDSCDKGFIKLKITNSGDYDGEYDICMRCFNIYFQNLKKRMEDGLI